MEIRRFQTADAEEVSALIIRTLQEVSSKTYSPEYIADAVSKFQPGDILKRNEWTHYYVACHEGKIVGCGAIGPYWDSLEESCLFNIFVLPEYEGMGFGRAIIQTIEQDEFFLRAKRVEIPASINGTPFYLKMGYTYKNGITTPDDHQHIRLEKHRDI